MQVSDKQKYAGQDSDLVRRFFVLEKRLVQPPELKNGSTGALLKALLSIEIPSLPMWIGEAGNLERMRIIAFITRVLIQCADADRVSAQEYYAKAEGRSPRQQTLAYDLISTLVVYDD